MRQSTIRLVAGLALLLALAAAAHDIGDGPDGPATTPAAHSTHR